MDNTIIANTTNVTMSDNINEIALALSKAQTELEAVEKGEKGYGYNYASLPATIQASKATLAKNNLAVTQLLGNAANGNPAVTTILLHNSGQYLKSVVSAPLIEMKGCNSVQNAGAVYSYLRRYSLQGILNMSSEDNDASNQGYAKPDTSTRFSTAATSEGGASRPQKFRKEANGVNHDI